MKWGMLEMGLGFPVGRVTALFCSDMRFSPGSWH